MLALHVFMKLFMNAQFQPDGEYGKDYFCLGHLPFGSSLLADKYHSSEQCYFPESQERVNESIYPLIHEWLR